MREFHYAAYGLKVASNLELAFAEDLIAPATRPNIRFHWAQQPASGIIGGVEIYRGRLTRAARVGNEIVVESAEAAQFRLQPEAEEVNGWSLGNPSLRLVAMLFSANILNFWLVEHGVRVLHASAVVADSGRAIAFAGNPGAGKSTLSAAALSYGMSLLTDDIAAFDPATGYLMPGFGELKLHDSLYQRLASDPCLPITAARRVAPELLKTQVRPAKLCREPRQLAALFFPEIVEDGGLELRPLSGGECARRLLGCSRLPGAYEGRLLQHELHSALSVAREVPAFVIRLGRTEELPRQAIDEIAQRL